MKKVVFLFVLLFIAGFVYSMNRKAELYADHATTIKAGHPQVIPTVTSDDDGVQISCDSILNDVYVVVYDQYGNVMHQSTLTVSPEGTNILIPGVDDDREITTIDLYYQKQRITGYFLK